MTTLYDRLNDSFKYEFKYECVPLSINLLKNKVKLALVKIAEQYDISIDIIEAILEDKKMTTRFMMPKIRLPERNKYWGYSTLCKSNDRIKTTFIRKCIMTEKRDYELCAENDPDFRNTCRRDLVRNYHFHWLNTTPTTKREFIKYIREDTSFKKNGGKYIDLQKKNKLQLLELIVKSPLCD